MFEEAHENFDGLRRAFAGEASPVEAERVVAHLTGCRECWLLANRAIAAQREYGGLPAQGPLRALIELQEIEQERLEEWLEAQAVWLEIRSLTAKARRDRVRLTRSLHTLSFLEVLLDEGALESPAEGEELFYLALLVSQQLPSSRVSVKLSNDLCAECCAEVANARRLRAKWAAARDALKKADEYVEKGSRNGVVEGKVLCVAGALEDDLGNTEEAASILRRAVGLFEASAQTLLLSRTLTQLAYTLVGEHPAEGLRVVEQALSLIPSGNTRLVWFAETTKIDCLIGIGAPQEALVRFNALKGLHEQFREPFIQIRRRFNAARILEHLGRLKKAEILFQEVIAGDLEHGLVKDLFLDLVYLFGFHLRQGQSSEAIAVCRRAGQELSLLDDEDGSGESARDQMRMVWRSLEDEVRRGTVDLSATTVLRNYIKAHWRFPASDPPSFGGRPAPASP
jgi:tetratricopeptide (TPR) repeat protein